LFVLAVGSLRKHTLMGDGRPFEGMASDSVRVYDTYGFFRASGNHPCRSPVLDIAAEKLKKGKITSKEYEHIISIVYPEFDDTAADDGTTPLSSAHLFHARAWQQYIEKHQQLPGADPTFSVCFPFNTTSF
jgi:hypothetical protein